MMPGRLKSVFSLIGPPTLYFSYAYTLFFKHFYRLMLLNSCIALLFFSLPAGGGFSPCSDADCKEGRSFHCPLFILTSLLCIAKTVQWPCCGFLPFTCCACRPRFVCLGEKAELSALPRMLPPSSPESISAMSIPKRCSSSYYPSAAAVFPPFYVAIASHTYHCY